MARRILPVLFVVCVGVPAFAEPPAPLEDRAAILKVEMRRGPARDLAPFLAADANPQSRQTAIRALGRIGDQGDAPAMLAELLASPGDDLPYVLWAAGTAQSEDLADPISKHLTSDDPTVVAAAAVALGWTGKEGASERLAPLLTRPEPMVRAAVLESLGRLRADGHLERAARFVLAPEPEVRASAAFACWLLASKRRQVATANDPDWDGDEALCRVFLPLLGEKEPERRMAGIRPLGSLLPKQFPTEDRFHVIRELIRDPDPRVTQDVVWRILTDRVGAALDEMLTEALAHEDPKVRDLAVQAWGRHDTDAARAVLLAGLATEQDARVREAILVEHMRLGIGVPVRELRVAPDRPEDAALRQLTEARILLLAKGEDDLTDLLEWADVSSPTADAIHPIVWMEIADGLEGREEPAVEEWVGWMLANATRMDPYVLASVVALAGKNGMHAHREALTGDVLEAALAAAEPDAAQALAEALATLAKDEDVEPESEAACRAALRSLLSHPSAFAKAAVREAMTSLEMEGVPEGDAQPANDWKGLPRPVGPVLGLDLAGQDPWLDETEILRIADKITEENPRIVFQTTAGAFAIELDAEAAPVHAVSLLLAVQAGRYDGTRWHRVVPNFVIQGGDPHGHGAGGGGWTVPDEISERRYVRGALGMPKSTKDDGGCQLFFMHTAYRPLDGRYTNYGRVVSGMETVDAIRVGDAIRGARIVLGTR